MSVAVKRRQVVAINSDRQVPALPGDWVVDAAGRLVTGGLVASFASSGRESRADMYRRLVDQGATTVIERPVMPGGAAPQSQDLIWPVEATGARAIVAVEAPGWQVNNSKSQRGFELAQSLKDRCSRIRVALCTSEATGRRLEAHLSRRFRSAQVGLWARSGESQVVHFGGRLGKSLIGVDVRRALESPLALRTLTELAAAGFMAVPIVGGSALAVAAQEIRDLSRRIRGGPEWIDRMMFSGPWGLLGSAWGTSCDALAPAGGADFVVWATRPSGRFGPEAFCDLVSSGCAADWVVVGGDVCVRERTPVGAASAATDS